MGQYKNAQQAYRETAMRQAMPHSRQAYNYGDIVFYGIPASDKAKKAKSNEALLRLSHDESLRFKQAQQQTCTNWQATPENWDMVRQVLNKKPLLTIERAKEMVTMTGGGAE